ncbi:SOS cell division inhibitor SulA [Marinimicrobium koreense]|uniref:SOS cell division inhibitor SulA n=1 Tax=Marinimicrobium koreense TaxID=306545 RepID=A0A3N1P0T5_9GAMM|nr:SulA-like leucine-rich domain-containing protein [Marinimicrobium koreense]ROQ20320.1 SOS cell division inhibitor SulA [Marinimicrobium koreense]
MINAPIQSASPAPAGGITELVLTHNAPEQTQLLLPMVAHLSRTPSDRWLTWISPGPVDRRLLERYGVDTRSIRLIHAPETDDNRWILWEALAKGNSHTVIASPGALSDRELKQLEAAALQGQCQALLLRVR